MRQVEEVRRLDADGESNSEIARRLGVSRPTVRKYLARDDFSVPAPVSSSPARPSRLDGYRDWLVGVLTGDRAVRPKQRHTAQRLFERLVSEQGYEGSYSVVQRFVKRWHEAERLAGRAGGFNDLVWPAGFGQVDFGEADFDEGTGPAPKSFLVVSFPFSNQGFTQVFDGETAECVCRGLADVFTTIGGVPPVLVFDNAAGVGHRVIEQVKEADLFRLFRLHYGFQARFCNPESGWEKGNVENKVGFIRRHLFVPIPDITGVSLERFNELLLIGAIDDERLHYEKDRPVGELFTQDQAALLVLPAKPFDPVRWASYRVDGYGQVTVDGVHVYSVSPQAAGQQVWLGFRAHTVEILAATGARLAVHRRGYGKKRTSHVDQAQMMTALIGKHRAWGQSQLRADIAGRPGQRFIDSLDKAGFNDYLAVMARQASLHGLAQVLDSLDWLVDNKRQFTTADLVTVASRADGFGLDRPPDTGPDLGRYDDMFGMPARQAVPA
jgi:transposase